MSRSLMHQESKRREASFWTLLTLFGGNGFQAGCYTLLIADLALSLKLAPGALGVALAALSAGGMAGVLAFGRLTDHWGRRPVLVIGCFGGGAFFIALGQVSGYAALVLAMAAGGALLSAFDLSPTTLGGDYEREHRSASMNPFFAAQDLGGALGAGLCGWAIAVGTDYSLAYAGVGVVLLSLGILSTRLPLPRAPDRRRGQQQPQATGSPNDASPRTSSKRLITRGVLLSATFVALISLVDAAMEGFSSLYLRDTLGAGPGIAGAAIAVSLIASSAGRLGGQALLHRTGEWQVLTAAGVSTAVAILILVATGLPIVAAVGLLMLRLCQGPIVPIAYSLAARSAPHRAGQAASLAWVSLYAAFLAGPLVVGAVAEATDLRLALALFVIAAAGIALLAATVARPVLSHSPHRESMRRA